MALFYTELSGSETDGEKLLYRTLRNLLSDEYVIWHNKRIPPRMTEADFIVLHPADGVWVIEVKDWARDQIVAAGEREFRVRKGTTVGPEPNPLEQSTQASFRMKELLKQRRELIQHGSEHDGKLLVPVNAVVALPNIADSELEDLRAFLPADYVLSRDFLRSEQAESVEWERRLQRARRVRFRCCLDTAQMAVIKQALGTAAVPCASDGPATLDDHQERLAAGDLDRQVVIEGPAGSGKSIVLLRRAALLLGAQPSGRVLVACFNAVMAAYLRRLAAATEMEPATRERLHIYDAYGWAMTFAANAPEGGDAESDGYTRRIEGVAQYVRYHPDLAYDAVLVDEGQDANDAYLRLYRALLKRPDGPFTFFLDERQLLYSTGSAAERLERVGFRVHRERRLVRQQRSILVMLGLAFYDQCKGNAPTPERAWRGVLETAEHLFFGIRNALQALATGAGRFLAGGRASSAGRFNPSEAILSAVGVSQHLSFAALGEEVAVELHRRHAGGKGWNEMMVLYLSARLSAAGGGEVIEPPAILCESLEGQGIPFVLVGRQGFTFDGRQRGSIEDNRRGLEFDSDAVRVMTVHQAKGLDASHLIVAGFDHLDIMQGAERAAEIGYVAITRAKHTARFMYCARSRSVGVLLDTIAAIRRGSNGG